MPCTRIIGKPLGIVGRRDLHKTRTKQNPRDESERVVVRIKVRQVPVSSILQYLYKKYFGVPQRTEEEVQRERTPIQLPP